jgi:hypothetical protein
LKKIKIEEELRRIERKGLLNIQPLVIRSPPHSSSSSKCAKRKAYSEKIQFAQMIIQNIYTTRTSTMEFLCRSRQRWHARKHTRLGATPIDLVCIEELEEDEVKEQHFVKA